MADKGLFSRLFRQDAASLRRRAEDEDERREFVKSAELWRRLADEGDADASFVMGERYEAGRGVVQSFVSATKMFAAAADRGHLPAQAKLGEIYFLGRKPPGSVSGAGLVSETADAPAPKGALASLFPGGVAVAQDFAQAAKWNRTAGAAGDAGAQVRMGLQYAAGLGLPQDYAQAQTWFAAAAAQGHDGGAFGLGMLYCGGHGGEVDLAKGAAWFEMAAEVGNAGAQFSLAILLWRGEGVEKDEARALALLTQAARAGQPEPLFILGQFHRFGIGGPIDLSEAETALRRAAARGHVRAMVSIAGVLMERPARDAAAASVYLRQAAELGDAEAQYALGQLYLAGDGAPKDGAQAQKWFKLAADQGFAPAYERLGALYAEGVGVERDLSEAAAWFHKAADEGNGQALFSLGRMHQTGAGVEQDAEAARALFSRAAEAGVAEAGLKLGVLHAQGETDAEDRERAATWWRAAAALGNLDAACNLGLLYVRGQGGEEEQAEGLRILEDAAARGSRAAHWAMHNLFAEGLYVKADGRQAQAWLVKAAEIGCPAAACRLAAQLDTHHPLAAAPERVLALLIAAANAGETQPQEQLGRFYFEGRYVEKSMPDALHWFGLAAQAGAPFAQAWMGDMLVTGNGVARDETAALEWYCRAADGGYLPAMSVLTSAATNSQTDPAVVQEIFRQWLKAAEAGDAMAQRMTGDFLLSGVGVAASTPDAVAWLRRASRQNDLPAKVMLAGVYLREQLEEEDGESPIELLYDAAEQGDVDAQYNLGVCYRLGLRLKPNLVFAEDWYRKAAGANHRGAQLALADLLSTSATAGERAAEAARLYAEAAQGGSAKAMHRLGQLYEQGRGVPSDLARARQYYQSAAATGHAEARQAYQRLAGVR